MTIFLIHDQWPFSKGEADACRRILSLLNCSPVKNITFFNSLQIIICRQCNSLNTKDPLGDSVVLFNPVFQHWLCLKNTLKGTLVFLQCVRHSKPLIGLSYTIPLAVSIKFPFIRFRSLAPPPYSSM